MQGSTGSSSDVGSWRLIGAVVVLDFRLSLSDVVAFVTADETTSGETGR